MMKPDEAKDMVLNAGKRLVKEGLVTRSWGNVSLRLDEKWMVVTPSGKKYEELLAAQMVLVNYHTMEYEGVFEPTSEADMHAAIFKARPAIKAVIHTHQVYATTVAVAGKEIPPLVDDQAQILGPSVKVTKYERSNSLQLANEVVEKLEGRNAVLIANHGAVCIGRSMDEAFVAAQILEKTCQVFIGAAMLGDLQQINPEEALRLHDEYMNDYSQRAKA
jgi:L-fuculose-phosphate aldolase